MAVTTNLSRFVRKGAPAFAAALTVLCAASAIAAPAGAAETRSAKPASTGAAARAWTPQLTPFSGGQERVHRHLSGADRSYLLHHCWPGYLCIAAGEGNGLHSVWELYYCTQRSLSNFIDAGAANNRQYGPYATLLTFKRDGTPYQEVRPDTGVVPVDWRPVWTIAPCA